ncbi:MAG: GTP 3',8-cyclase MoaA [Clostridiales bacterium]|nr:GTP 3',8-cyclase MoaA [Clostridiales bacterium]
MKDSFGREISYLRISVTQRCNLNCVYCGKTDCAKKETELSPENYYLIAKAFAKCGIKKVRITGGEPLVRNDICEIIKLIRSIPEIETLSLTTNGVFLKKYAQDLKSAGLDSVNISLDSTDGSTYRHLTGEDVLKKVLEGIDEAEKVGLSPIKINAVLMKGVNDDGAQELIELAKTRNIDVRFIELMPFSAEGENPSLIVKGDEILKQFPFLQPVESEEGTAKYYSADGFEGRVGLINPVTHKFCDKCNRVRLLSDGKVKPCLGYDTAYDIMPFINDGEKLIKEIKEIIKKKPAGHSFEDKKASHGLNKTGG